MTKIQQKLCLQCGEMMTKIGSHSQKYWDERRKYCSRSCRNKARVWTYEMKVKSGLAHSVGRNVNWMGGRSKSYLQRLVLERDNGTCQKCGLHHPEIMEVDHIKPRRVAPELKYHPDNLMTLCPNCHRRKTLEDHKLYPQEWRNQFSSHKTKR